MKISETPAAVEVKDFGRAGEGVRYMVEAQAHRS
jgi:hypothetical protein